jgi:hypothetical protein
VKGSGFRVPSRAGECSAGQSEVEDRHIHVDVIIIYQLFIEGLQHAYIEGKLHCSRYSVGMTLTQL